MQPFLAHRSAMHNSLIVELQRITFTFFLQAKNFNLTIFIYVCIVLQAYLSKLSIDQKKIYEELTVVSKSKQKINNNNDLSAADNMNGLVMIHGRKMSSSAMSNGFSNNAGGSGWFEYGAI